MRAGVFLLVLSLLTACGVDGGEPVGAERAALRDLDSTEQAFLDILNDYRRDNGLSPVMAERALNKGARDYSQLMGETGHFDHVGPDGSTFDQRMCEAGYDPGCGPRTFVAENIAAGQRTAREVFEAWRGSPGHNANMLQSRAVVVGIGRAVVSGSEYGVYWTNTFAGMTTSETVPLEPPDAGTGSGADAGSGSGADAGTGGGADGGGTAGDGGSLPSRRRARGGCAVAAGEGGGGAPLLALALAGLLLGRRRRFGKG